MRTVPVNAARCASVGASATPRSPMRLNWRAWCNSAFVRSYTCCHGVRPSTHLIHLIIRMFLYTYRYGCTYYQLAYTYLLAVDFLQYTFTHVNGTCTYASTGQQQVRKADRNYSFAICTKIRVVRVT